MDDPSQFVNIFLINIDVLIHSFINLMIFLAVESVVLVYRSQNKKYEKFNQLK